MAMQSQLQELDITSSNLANVNTSGYKANRGNFQELLSMGNPEGIRNASTQILLGQGALQTSGNPLDLAIMGEGFFAVTRPDGTTGYSRDGAFSLDENRQIVTSSGQRLVWQGQIPENFEEISVSNTGVVSVRVGDTWTQAGVIQTHRFPNPTALQMSGDNVYLATSNSGTAQAGAPGTGNYGTIRSQALEASNVNIASEMTHMITLQRAFQVSTRAFQTTDTMISLAISMRKG
jgi:flagellar basal-body rod protein FlgG